VTQEALSEQCDIAVIVDRSELDERAVAPSLELLFAIENERDASAHPGGEISTGGPENDDDASGHVLASVVTHAFHHSGDAAVPHREPLACGPGEVRLAGRRAIQRYVAE
jgi:hypothetical protein